MAREIGNDERRLLKHFLQCGMNEGRVANENFNVAVYKEKNNDLKQAFGEDLKPYYIHYIQFGHTEDRICNEVPEESDEPEKV